MDTIRLFLCGDVMTGRGVDQVMAHPSEPDLYERYVEDAREYVRLAEGANGPIGRAIAPGYIWGDALGELEQRRPSVRIINLETAVTRSPDAWPGKQVHYRMHPDNVGCLSAAGVDCCVLANNHVLDWGYEGLEETLQVLDRAGLPHAGAGRNVAAAASPVAIEVSGASRVLVFAAGSPTSGVPTRWAATETRAGVHWVSELAADSVERVAAEVARVKRAGDVVILSIHWGGNWGYDVPEEQVRFAHRLIDAGVHLVHGHSSHHVKPLEVYRGHLILYGCGDLITDYEGIPGHEGFRPDLSLMYFPTLDRRDGRLLELRMVPMRIRRFRLNRASFGDALWLRDMLNLQGARFGARVRLPDDDNTLTVGWA